MNLYRKTLSLLTPREKRRGGLVLGMVVTWVDTFILSLGVAAFGLILFSAFSTPGEG